MRHLIVMRHAKSDWSEPGRADHQRPLNKRGRRVAKEMGTFLAEQGIDPDIICCSTATRAQETMELLQPKLARQVEVLFSQELYLASALGLCKHLAGLHDSWTSAMVVGHNPGLSILASGLAKQTCELPTAAVVVLQSPAETWPDAFRSDQWQLLEFWKPKEL